MRFTDHGAAMEPARARSESQERRRDNGDTVVEPDGDDATSFALLCRAIGTEGLTDATTLGSLWAANPQTVCVEGLGAGRPPVVQVGGIGSGDTYLRGNIVGALADGLPSNVDDALSVLRQRLIDHYPGATDGLVVDAVNVDAEGRAQVEISWRTPAGKRRPIGEFATGLTRSPRSGAYLLPALNNAGDTMPFLPLWWATLLALSSIARYSPDRWVAALARDRSRQAMPIEGALQNAHELLPHMLLAEFRREPEDESRPQD
jgi:hypothetical protein